MALGCRLTPSQERLELPSSRCHCSGKSPSAKRVVEKISIRYMSLFRRELHRTDVFQIYFRPPISHWVVTWRMRLYPCGAPSYHRPETQLHRISTGNKSCAQPSTPTSVFFLFSLDCLPRKRQEILEGDEGRLGWRGVAMERAHMTWPITLVCGNLFEGLTFPTKFDIIAQHFSLGRVKKNDP